MAKKEIKKALSLQKGLKQAHQIKEALSASPQRLNKLNSHEPKALAQGSEIPMLTALAE